MAKFSSTPLGFLQVLRDCFINYPIVLKKTWALILLSAILNLIGTVVLKLNPYVGSAVMVLILLAVAFLYAIILHVSNEALYGREAQLKNSVANAKKRYLPLLGGYVVLFLIGAIIAVIDYALIAAGDASGMRIVFGIFAAIAALFTIFLIFLFYFALPLIVLEKNGVFKSFENSVKLVWGSWWFTFGILLIVHFVVIAIGLLVTSIIPSRDIIILALWNFIFSIFAYPLIISTTLTLLHHLKLRHPNVGQAI